MREATEVESIALPDAWHVPGGTLFWAAIVLAAPGKISFRIVFSFQLPVNLKRSRCVSTRLTLRLYR